jgi:transposase-like protein
MYAALIDQAVDSCDLRPRHGTMGAVNDRTVPRPRNSLPPRAAPASDYTLAEFWRDYPDDAACLERLWRDRFAPDGHRAYCPKCECERKFHRTRTRASYTCDTCGRHVHPMKGTIFEKSRTSLRLWFYAMYLLISTRGGLSTKQLEGELGVGYKTADRMRRRIEENLMPGPAYSRPGGELASEPSLGRQPLGRQPLGRAPLGRRRADAPPQR